MYLCVCVCVYIYIYFCASLMDAYIHFHRIHAHVFVGPCTVYACIGV